MKVISFLCLIAMLGGRAFTAENVNISLISLSVQIDPARAEDDIGLEWNLRISSIPDEAIVNGEAAVADLQSNFSNEGFFLLEDPFTGDIAVLPFQMDTPFLDDSNGNGLVDFDDVSVAVVNEQTTGIFFNPASGQFDDMDLVWNRDAGSSTG